MSFQSQKSIMPGKQDWSQASIGIGTERRTGRGVWAVGHAVCCWLGICMNMSVLDSFLPPLMVSSSNGVSRVIVLMSV